MILKVFKKIQLVLVPYTLMHLIYTSGYAPYGQLIKW